MNSNSKVIDGVEFDYTYMDSPFIKWLEKLDSVDERRQFCKMIKHFITFNGVKHYLKNTDPNYFIVDGIDFTETVRNAGFDGHNFFDRKLKETDSVEQRKKLCKDAIKSCENTIKGFKDRLKKEKNNEIQIWIYEREDIICVAQYYLTELKI